MLLRVLYIVVYWYQVFVVHNTYYTPCVRYLFLCAMIIKTMNLVHTRFVQLALLQFVVVSSGTNIIRSNFELKVGGVIN